MSVEQCSCDPQTVKSAITVLHADYGRNCGDARGQGGWPGAGDDTDETRPAVINQVALFTLYLLTVGHQTDNLARACNGRQECSYLVDDALIGNKFVNHADCNKKYRVW